MGTQAIILTARIAVMQLIQTNILLAAFETLYELVHLKLLIADWYASKNCGRSNQGVQRKTNHFSIVLWLCKTLFLMLMDAFQRMASLRYAETRALIRCFPGIRSKGSF